MIRTILLTAIFSFSLFANSFGINLGKGHDLEERVKKLEQEVSELKSEMRSLRDRAYSHPPVQTGGPVIIMPSSAPAPSAPAHPTKTYSCFIETPFKGTFTAKGETQGEAKGKTLKACTDGGGGISCSSSKVKCED